MKTKLLAILFLTLIVNAINAEQRTLEQMQQIALSVLNQSPRRTGIKKASASTASNQPQILRETENLAFVGYSNDGFVVISKDDRNEAILGYSNEIITNEELPDGLNWWISAMDSTLMFADTQSSLRKSNRQSPQRTIPALINTRWGQKKPYNDLLKDTLDGNACQFVTGCIATAMAQIIKFHEYPTRGLGSHKYYIKYSNLTDTLWLESDFSSHTYDYSNMLNKYSALGYDTDAQKNAVATLMKDCGISVDMQYNGTASGAYSRDIPNALKTYFDYDENVQICKRSELKAVIRDGTLVLDTVFNYTSEEWKQLIVNELEEFRPILYGGKDATSGGHAFIIDGIDSNGFVHVNWGWNGNYDGYYDIDLLNPNNDSYVIFQDAIIGIEPKNRPYVSNYYALTLTVLEAQGGEVYGAGTYKAEEQVVIKALPDYHYHFVRWSDGATDNPRTITLFQDTALEAEFSDKYMVSVSCDTLCGTIEGESGEVKYGKTVTFKAIAKDGYHFVKWSDGYTLNPRSIFVKQDTTIIAEFAPDLYTLSVTWDSQQCNVIGESGEFAYGTEHTFEVVPRTGFRFVKWSDNIVINPRTIILKQHTDLSVQCVQVFSVRFYDINKDLIEEQIVAIGKNAIAPTPPIVEHYDFIGWSASYTNVRSDLDIYALYEPNTENLRNVSQNGTNHSKILLDGQVMILRGDKTFTVTGQEIK